ncbi:hypothetical protein DFP73DRAFT_599750 [Morchella snyderi]|nr:hypothetical protein DFP73DRAFT_599750 [Morchella snyderi]
MRSSFIQNIVTDFPTTLGPWVNLGIYILKTRLSPWVDAVEDKLPTVMAAPSVNDICTSCNVPLVSYCCAAEGTKRADITTNCVQEVPFVFEFNTPQINAIANYAQYFLGIDIDSFRLAISQQIVAPCPHRERDPEVTTWQRLTPPPRPSKRRPRVYDNTDISMCGVGKGYWGYTRVKWPGGYHGAENPRPYVTMTAYTVLDTPTGPKDLYGPETRVQTLQRLHSRNADMRYKYIDRQKNYKSRIRQGTPHVPRDAVVGQLNRVETPKWYRQMQLPFMRSTFWKHGIRIRPQRNGKIDRVTGNMEYNDAFYQEGAETMYPHCLNLGKDIPLAPTLLDLWTAKPPRLGTPVGPPHVLPVHNRHRLF